MLVRVGFSRGTTWVARLICVVTNTDISHSFFHVSDDTGEWVYEAVPQGFRRVSWDAYQQENVVKALVDMEWPHSQVKRSLDSMLGMRYALLTFMVLTVLMLARRAARRPRRLARDAVDCVTSVSRLLKEYALLDLGEVITPAELKEKLHRK